MLQLLVDLVATRLQHPPIPADMLDTLAMVNKQSEINCLMCSKKLSHPLVNLFISLLSVKLEVPET